MIVQKDDALFLTVKVVPNSSRTEVVGPMGKPAAALKVKVAQPPEDGKANRAVIALLAETLGIAPSRLTLVSGQTRPLKVIQIAGVTMDAALRALST